MHGSVFLDASDGVIRPALLWNDQRTGAQCEEITRAVGGERLISIAGNPALTGFQAPKIVWLRDEEPENFGRVARVLLPKDYVRLQLTGEYATDASDAAGTLLLDVRARDWSGEILEALAIPEGWMPKVHEGPESTGALRGGVAEELGLPPGIPVAAGGGDNAAAAVGTGIVGPGLVNSSVGTSGVLFAHAGEFNPDPSGRLHAFCHAVPGAYHLMGVTLSAGGSLSWWRETVGGGYDELVGAASEVQPGSEGLIFLPYLSGERTPHLDPDARGAFLGLTARHGVAHMTRAVMEGVVFSLRDSLEIMRGLGVPVEDVRATVRRIWVP
jgi:xylulokinase